LILASILWSLIPAIVVNLFDQLSIFTILFLRFLIAGIFFFFLALLFIFFNNKKMNDPQMRILLRNLFKYINHRNKRFFNVKFIYYYCILGFFGIILQVIFYFLALKETTIAFTMIGYQISIILVAFYEHGVEAEKLDFFKVLYLIILIFCISIISHVQFQLYQHKQPVSISFLGFLYVFSMAICMSFLNISMGKESFSKEEIEFSNRNKNFKMVKLLFKISLVFLTGILFMIPFLLVVYFFPFSMILTKELMQFLFELTILPSILIKWEILFLIIFSTVIPYLLFFIASVNWNPYYLTFSQWESIVMLIEPIGGILFGVLLIGEFFPLDFLIIVLFLLSISILLRYAHESRNKVNALILLKYKFHLFKGLPLKLLKLNGITRVESLIGTHDLLLTVKTNSIKELYYLINTELKTKLEMDDVEILFMTQINKLETI